MAARCIRVVARAVTLSIYCVWPALAQDTRHVTEPVIPSSCTVLRAELQATNNAIAEADETKLDTQRIQSALDACAGSGRAVELTPGWGRDA